METEENADKRREAAIASSPSLRPNFDPKTGITAAQVSKFQELHKRRLQIKAKFKVNKKSKGNSHRKSNESSKCTDENLRSIELEDSSSVPILVNREKGNLSKEESNAAVKSVTNKHQKLFWGLDTKERWERKSNM